MGLRAAFGMTDNDDEWRRKVVIAAVLLFLVLGVVAYGFVNRGTFGGGASDADPCEAGSSAPVCD